MLYLLGGGDERGRKLVAWQARGTTGWFMFFLGDPWDYNRRGNVRPCLRETRRRLIVKGYQGGNAKTSKGGGCVELERLGEGGGGLGRARYKLRDFDSCKTRTMMIILSLLRHFLHYAYVLNQWCSGFFSSVHVFE